MPGGKGIRMADKQGVFENDEDYFNHLEMEHDLVIRREGETDKQAKARVKAKNPRMGTENCQCPACLAKRSLGYAGALEMVEKLRVSRNV